jgi:hypothetical protein
VENEPVPVPMNGAAHGDEPVAAVFDRNYRLAMPLLLLADFLLGTNDFQRSRHLHLLVSTHEWQCTRLSQITTASLVFLAAPAWGTARFV